MGDYGLFARQDDVSGSPDFRLYGAPVILCFLASNTRRVFDMLRGQFFSRRWDHLDHVLGRCLQDGYISCVTNNLFVSHATLPSSRVLGELDHLRAEDDA